MTRPTQLPEISFTPLTTRRLARPQLLWQDDRARDFGFDAERVFCSPATGDPEEAYTGETRVEWADRYGGIGVGTAGGSGRCAAWGGLQTKGVGVTPLVGHDVDVHHSSGTLPVQAALVETLFAPIYQAALPFGAVPTLAVLLVHRAEGEPVPPAARALTVRPFVLRPAHFMRNVLYREQRLPQGAAAPGFTRDAYRVTQALLHLTAGVRGALGVEAADPVSTLDAGLRELARRLAWQFAASFAKRLPHGSVGCANMSLAGEFMDYGMSLGLPTYRRPTDAMQDPFTEGQRGLQTLLLLREQLDKYFPGLRGAGVVLTEELAHQYLSTLDQRLAVEMVRMAGLTEDLAQACPPGLLVEWTQAMRGIWLKGAQEPLQPREAGTAWRPLPVDPRRPDLNRVLAAAAPHGNPEAMERAIAPFLADVGLRQRFVAAAVAVRAALRPLLGSSAGALDAYMGAQACRKNAVLPELERDSWFRIAVVTQMLDADFEPSVVRSLLAGAVGRARHALSDLSPDLPGANGFDQVQAMAQRPVSSSIGNVPVSVGPVPPAPGAGGAALARKRVLLIVDYFGRWPEWFDVFLLSCAHNPDIDWLIHTDCPLPAQRPDNVRFVQLSFGDYCARVSDRLDLQFSPYRCEEGKLSTPLYINLCDLRPCYADLHPEAIEGYDYFGWCDIDVVFGNLRRFLTPDVLERNLITFSAGFCCGHFTLLKNTPAMRRMYHDIPDWRRRIEGRNGPTPWEDCLDEAWLTRLCSPPGTPFRAQALALGVQPQVIDRYRWHHAFIRECVTPFTPGDWIDGQRVHPEVWYWRGGELTNWRDGPRPFPYLHMMNFKQHRHIENTLYGMQATWERHCPVDPGVPGADVIRIDRGGIAGLSSEAAAADQRQLHEQRRVAQGIDTSGLSLQRALEALGPAGVAWQEGVLTDRAGAVPPALREALWRERSEEQLRARR